MHFLYNVLYKLHLTQSKICYTIYKNTKFCKFFDNPSKSKWGSFMFKIIAILIMAAFYGCYFGKMISQRKRGIQTDQMGKGKKGFVKFIELAMKVTAIVMGITELVCILFVAEPEGLIMRCIGAVIGITGAVSFVVAAITMQDNWRAGVPEKDKTELVTHGIYSISRNPAFIGFDLVYIGIMLMFFNWVLLVFTVFAVIIFHLQIVNVEEDYLIVTFKDEYIDYTHRVNRYFGRKKQR